MPPGRLDVAESIGLLQAPATVPDPRRARGRRHGLQSVLLLAVGAVLAGARSYTAIAQWARCAEQAVAVCGPTPHASTFGRVLSAVDPVVLQRTLTGWVMSRREAHRRQRLHGVRPREEDRTVLAVDGKTLRGARDEYGEQTKLVAVLDHVEQLALSQVEVAGGDELAAFVPALDTIADLHEVVVTADALHCQRAHADYLHTRGAHYLFTVKGNQPTLRRALARLPRAQVHGNRDRTVGHGRIESRSVKVIDLDGTPEAGLFPHGARAIKVVRRRRPPARPSRRWRPSTRSPPSTTATPSHGCSPPGSVRTGRSRTACTGSATSPRVRTTPACAPATARKSWPPYATPRSTSPDSAARPTSPPPTVASATDPPTSWTRSPPRDRSPDQRIQDFARALR